MLVVISLLRKKISRILFCIKIMINFVTMIQYYSYTKNTINYLEHYMKIFNIIKKNLRFYQNDKTFNLFKMYNLIHYIHFIRKFDVLFFVNIAIYKIDYIDYLKKSFKRTNKRSNYERQLLTYDTRLLNFSTTIDLTIYKQNRVET